MNADGAKMKSWQGELFCLKTSLTVFSVLLLGSTAFPSFAAASPAPAATTPTVATLSSQAQSLVDQTVAWQKGTGHKWDALAAKALLNMVEDVKHNGWPNQKCKLDNVYVRREWNTFSKQEKKDYISAVLCLQKQPSKLNPVDYPGARNRYDDFVGIHINQTLSIHSTGNFLSWHRYFTWAYEWTLRNECGYKGYQPYVNWGNYASNPLANPLFDGSDTSISGDGKFFAHGNVVLPFPAEPDIILPPQNGGGCVKSGPFVNWTVNLGPNSAVLPYIPPNPQPNGFGYNPRCLIRDLSSYVSSHWTKDSDIYDLIVGFTNITAFQRRFQGDLPNGYLGIHAGGHYTIGGDPGGDFFASPGDPYFFFHHSAVDRLYWTWQNLSPQTRTYVIGDTITFNNTPPSRDATLDDPLDLGPVGLAGVLKIRNAVSVLGGSGGPFCYIYA